MKLPYALTPATSGKLVFAGYAIFLLCLAFEWNVNEGRTVALMSSLVHLWCTPDTRRSLFQSSQFRAALLFPAIALLSWLFGSFGEYGLKTFDWLFCLTIGYTASASMERKTIVSLAIIPLAAALGAAGMSIWHLLQDGNLSALFYDANKMMFYNSSANRMGFTFLLSGAIAMGLYPLAPKRFHLPLLALFAVLSFLCWLCQSRAAVFALAGTAGFATLLFIRQDWRKALPVALILGGVFTAAGFYLGGERILETLSKGSWEFLLNGRGDIWQAAWENFLNAPLFGHGVNSFREVLEAHLALPENAGRFPAIRSQYIFWNAHQIVLGILCETGLAGLLVFSFIIFRAFRTALNLGQPAMPMLLMLTAYIIHGLGAYGFHRSWNSAFFFLAIGLIEGLPQSNAAQPGQTA